MTAVLSLGAPVNRKDPAAVCAGNFPDRPTVNLIEIGIPPLIPALVGAELFSARHAGRPAPRSTGSSVPAFRHPAVLLLPFARSCGRRILLCFLKSRLSGQSHRTPCPAPGGRIRSFAVHLSSLSLQSLRGLPSISERTESGGFSGRHKK